MDINKSFLAFLDHWHYGGYLARSGGMTGAVSILYELLLKSGPLILDGVSQSRWPVKLVSQMRIIIVWFLYRLSIFIV